LAIALAAVQLAGQQPRDPVPGGGPAAARPSSRTATISGVITADDSSNAPLRRAIVSINGGDLTGVRSAITDVAGRFTFGGLAAGRYTVVATKAAYLDASYGAARPGRAGTAVTLAADERREIAIRMTRGSAIEGVVRDELGSPLPNITVQALAPGQPANTTGPAAPVAAPSAVTDDRGMYRIFGIAPGEYVVAAIPSLSGEGEIGRRQDADVDALLSRLRTTPPAGAGAAARPRAVALPRGEPVGYAPVYYPGVPLPSAAERVHLAAAEDRRGVDLVILPVKVASIEGTVTRSDGQPLGNVQLSVDAGGMPISQGVSRLTLSQPPGPDGRFRYTNVTPGHYTITAREGIEPASGPGRGGGGAAGASFGFSTSGTGAGPGASPSSVFAVAEVDVLGEDVSGLSLTLRGGVSLSGRLVFDSTSAPPDPGTIRVALARPGGSYMVSFGDGTRFGSGLPSPAAASVGADGTFHMAGVPPGTYALNTVLPPAAAGTWWLRSAVQNGRDLLDTPLMVREDDLTGAVLTLTDRHSELTGSLRTSAGLPAADYFIVVMPVEPGLRQAGSRRVKSARPATDGSFSIRDLPAGAYLLAALTDFEPRDVENHEFLEQLAAPGQAIPVTMRDGETTHQDIQIAR
jgi:uncharacterized protein (DUF2141 family)